MKNWFKREAIDLPMGILHPPLEDMDHKVSEYKKATDEVIVDDLTMRNTYLILFLFVTGPLLLCIWISGVPFEEFLFEETESLFVRIAPLLGFIGLPLTILIFALSQPKKEVTYDRKNGTITFSIRGWSKTYPFESMSAALKVNAHNNCVEVYPNKDCSKSFTIINNQPSGEEAIRYWSFIVWYMDRNRELPPFARFDPYREKDLERLRKENFPQPLYERYIDVNTSEIEVFYDEQEQYK